MEPDEFNQPSMPETSETEGAPAAGRYHLKLMFEWRGGALWCNNEAALRRFDVGEVEEKLGLSPALLRRLEELGAWHDTALDWDDPGGPSPWPPEEFVRFAEAARGVLREVQAELGPEFVVTYRGY